MITSFILASALALLPTQVLASNNGLAITPQMGWNTWNKYGCNIDEQLILDAAKAVVSSGLKDYGYNYVVIDDCWQKNEREKNKTLLPDPTKFPRGMKPLVDDIHAMGLKVGIYSSAGTLTCGGHIASLGYEEIDAKTWASWGMDYLKYDNCYNQGQSGTPKLSYDRYNVMSQALNKTGRPILYSLCNWGEDGPWNFASTIGNSWRLSGDIYDNFNRPDPACPCETYDCLLPGFRCSVMNIINKSVAVAQKARSGGWNDMDMLEVGNGGMTHEEYRLHYTMWAALKSPLLLGNDVTNMTAQTKEIIMNDEVIAVNQDSSYSPAVRMWVKGDQQMFSGSLANNTQVVILLNAGDKATKMTATWDDIWFYSLPNVDSSKSIEVRDLWQKKNLGKFSHQITLDVPAHGVRMVKFMGSAQSS
ncbi:alpha-galactosidase [Umbelopsis sp. PMI_123]|nr:alpha-galactosidase [Umbelopsis sp. PMI_123]